MFVRRKIVLRTVTCRKCGFPQLRWSHIMLKNKENLRKVQSNNLRNHPPIINQAHTSEAIKKKIITTTTNNLHVK